jgi:hypothetical protein
MKTFLIAAIAAVSSSGLAPSAQTPMPGTAVDPAMVGKLESEAVMPRRAAKLAGYERYYVRAKMVFHMPDETTDERDVIAGVWLLGGTHQDGAVPIPGHAGAFSLPSGILPLVYDGGCSVLTVYFDLKTQTFLFTGNRPQAATAVCNAES